MSDHGKHQITSSPRPASEPEAPAGPHGTAHEEAAHAQHASHDPFDRRVAITMVVIAAVLAGVKVLGHRAHNDVLRYNIEAGQKRTEADTLHTKAVAASTRASNQWSYYQAKKLR